MRILLFLFCFNGFALEVQGHRGARAVRPENTMAAFRYAVAEGVDTLEMDMHVTKDDQIVLTHDPFLNPELCLDAKKQKIKPDILVRGLTLEELKTYDCGILKNPKFPKQTPIAKTPIPTLDELFAWIKKSQLRDSKAVHFNIETKTELAHPDYAPNPEEFVKLFLSVVKKHKMLSRVTLQSFDYRTLKIAHRLEPKLKLSVLTETRPDDVVAIMKAYHAKVFSPLSDWLKPEDVVALHKAHARVIPWTANTPEEWARLIKMGVDGIITDDPKALLIYLKRSKPDSL